MPDHPERAWHVVQDLRDILTELAHRTAAGRAGTRCGVLHDIARQRLGQPPAYRLAHVRELACFGRCNVRVFWAGLGQQLVDIGERQLKLLDPRAQLFRRAAERHAQQSGEPRLERLDLEALLDDAGARRRQFRFPCGDLRRLRRDHRLQGGDIARQVGGHDRHNERLDHGPASHQAKPARDGASTRHFRLPRTRRHPPVDPFGQHR